MIDVEYLKEVLKGGYPLFKHSRLHGYKQADLVQLGFPKAQLKKLARKGIIEKVYGAMTHENKTQTHIVMYGVKK